MYIFILLFPLFSHKRRHLLHTIIVPWFLLLNNIFGILSMLIHKVLLYYFCIVSPCGCTTVHWTSPYFWTQCFAITNRSPVDSLGHVFCDMY